MEPKELHDLIDRARAAQPPEFVPPPGGERQQEQLPLPPPPGGTPRARGTDPATSHEAARSVDPEALLATQAAVLDVLREFGRLTDERIAELYEDLHVARGWPRQSPSGLRTRRAELVDAALVRASGDFGVTDAGRSTIKWELDA